MKNPVFINSSASISSLGHAPAEIWKSYQEGKALFRKKSFGNQKEWVASLAPETAEKLTSIRGENSLYQKLDDSVLLAIYASRQAVQKSKWQTRDFGINIGSSRGATGLFEKHHQKFLETGSASTLASPTTTLGNISSWVLQDLDATGIEISHSITCSTALHSVVNGVAWLQAGMSKHFLVGGSEAPLTPFTIGQMKALKLYANPETKTDFLNKSMDFSKKENTMILGEAAASFCLSAQSSANWEAKIIGMGYASEKLIHNISISSEADCLQKSMQMALDQAGVSDVDAIVLHAPGTKKGDMSELKAIQQVFPKRLPQLTSNKFMIGHTFGASGGLSLEMAILMLKHQQFIENPHFQNTKTSAALNTILVNAVGFGGNAVSLILSK